MTMGAHNSAKRLAFAGFLCPLWEFGAGKYFTDHHTPYTIHDLRDSILVCQIHDCYCKIRKYIYYVMWKHRNKQNESGNVDWDESQQDINIERKKQVVQYAMKITR